MFGYFCKKSLRPPSLLHVMTLAKIEEDIDDEDIIDLANFERRHYLLIICQLLYKADHLQPNDVIKMSHHPNLNDLLFAIKTLLSLFAKEITTSVLTSILPIILEANAPRAIMIIVTQLKKNGRLHRGDQSARYLEPLIKMDSIDMMSAKLNEMIEEDNQRAFFEGNFALVALNMKASSSSSTRRRARSQTFYDLTDLIEKSQPKTDKEHPKSGL